MRPRHSAAQGHALVDVTREQKRKTKSNGRRKKNRLRRSETETKTEVARRAFTV